MLRIEQVTDLTDCHALRRQVFVVEQQVSIADEWDAFDPISLHFLARWKGRPVGSVRVIVQPEALADELPDGMQQDAPVIGRVCVLAEFRGAGIGAALIRAALATLRQGGVATYARLAAQTHAIGFYEALGFSAYGPVFDDAGIDHRWMQVRL